MTERNPNHKGKVTTREAQKIKLQKAGTNVLLGLSGASMLTGLYFVGEAVHSYTVTAREIESKYPSPTSAQKKKSEHSIDHFSEQIDQAIEKKDFNSAIIFQSKKKDAEKTIQLWNSHVEQVLKEKTNGTKENVTLALPFVLGGGLGGASGLFIVSKMRKDGKGI